MTKKRRKTPSTDPPSARQSHDSGYKAIFSCPHMVRELIEYFVADEALCAQLDFASLQSVKDHYVTEDLRQRADDVVWKIRYGEQWIYLYLLIEFQSQEDWHMALRMWVYVGLLYQDLLKQGVISPKEPLPPVLPIVLYNGSRRWKAPQRLEALQYPDLPPFLQQWQPRMAYLLIDQGAYPLPELLKHPESVLSCVFQIEQMPTWKDGESAMKHMDELTASNEAFAQVRKVLTQWLRWMLSRPGMPFDGLDALPETMKEVRSMFSERWRSALDHEVKQYREEWLHEGLTKGKIEGREEGLQRGLLEGEQRTLIRLLSRRFGPLPESAKAKISEASLESVEAMTDAVLEAPSLQAVLEAGEIRH
jgi:predicted transposase YdaD